MGSSVPQGKMRRSRRLRLVAMGIAVAAGVSAAAGITVGGMASPAAYASGGTTVGVPQAPTQLYLENFENDPTSDDSAVLLTDYTGATGQHYTADPDWLTDCNGLIIDSRTSSADLPAQSGNWSACSQGRIDALTDLLGDLPGGPADPADNHALTTYTSVDATNQNGVEFATDGPLPLNASNRFITFSIDVAATDCHSSTDNSTGQVRYFDPELSFFLMDGATSIPTSAAPIDPCVDAAGTVTPAQNSNLSFNGYYGTHYADSPVLFTGTDLGIRLENQQTSNEGNDAAIDNIRVLDVTPQLDESFSPTPVATGGTSVLTFTVTNTSDLGTKDGWSFDDALPTGLTVASTPDATTTCDTGSLATPASVITAASGAASISVTAGALDAGATSCTVSVDVTSDTAATYTNDSSRLTGVVGLNEPSAASVRFTSSAAGSSATSDSALAYTGSDGHRLDGMAGTAGAVVALGIALVLTSRRRRVRKP